MSNPIKILSGRLILLLLSVWLVTLIMLPNNPLNARPVRDSGVFLYGGQQLLLGEIPYIDFWDHKGPLIYYLNAVGLLIGEGSHWGVWLLEFGFLILTAVGMYWVANYQWGAFSGYIALAFWAYFMSLKGPYPVHGTNYTERYSTFFNVWMVCTWLMAYKLRKIHWIFFVTGLMGGFSFVLRPNNVGTALTIILVEFCQASKIKILRKASLNILFLVLGSFTIPIFFLLLLIHFDALSAAIDAVFKYNFFYAQSGNLSFYQFLNDGITGMVWSAAILWILNSVRLLRNHSSASQENSEPKFMWFLLLGWPIEIILTSISKRSYPHYFITWIPYLAWLVSSVAIFIPMGLKGNFGAIYKTLLPYVSLLLAIFWNLSSIDYLYKVTTRLVFERDIRHTEVLNPVVRYVVVNTEPHDYVLAWGNEVWINFLSDRKSPTKYAYQYPLFMHGYSNGEIALEFLKDLQEHPPKLIVETTEWDYREIVSLSSLMEQQDIIPQLGLPSELEDSIVYIKQNYCIQVVMKDATIYQQITDATSEYPCQYR